MDEEKDEATLIFDNLAHPIRQKILLYLYQSPRTYTSIQSFLDIERGQLNFHLKKLEPLLLREGNLYRLNRKGLLAVSILKHAGKELTVKKKPRLFIRRVLAWFIDVFMITLIVIGPYIIDPVYWEMTSFMGIALPRIIVEILNIFFFMFVIYTQRSIEMVLYRISVAMILFGYWALFEGYSGQSLGKKIMRIRIRGRRGPIQPVEAAILAFGKAFFLPIDLLGLLIYRKEGSVRITEHITGAKVVAEGSEE